jgi:transcriptional regulator with XRE-family HTH domain
MAEARQRRGLAQDDVARLLNTVTGLKKAVSRHEVSRWERGARLPSPYWLAWIAVALNESWELLDKARSIDLEVRGDVQAGRERVSARGAELITPTVIYAVRTAAERWRSRQPHDPLARQLTAEQVEELRGLVARALVDGITEHFGLSDGDTG